MASESGEVWGYLSVTVGLVEIEMMGRSLEFVRRWSSAISFLSQTGDDEVGDAGEVEFCVRIMAIRTVGGGLWPCAAGKSS